MAGRNLFADQPQAKGRNLFAPQVEQPVAPPAPDQVGVVEDVAKSGGSGFARGVADLIGLPGTIGDAINSGLSYVTGLPKLPSSVVSGDALRKDASAVTGGATDYQPQTTAGEYARTGGEFLPSAVALGGVNPLSIARNAILPAVTSETAGQMTEGTKAEPYARVVGALAGGALPSLAKRAVTPFPISPERQAAVQALKGEGVNLTAGQASGSKMLQAAESELGGSAAADLIGKQGDEFTGAVLKKAGITDATRATPEVIDNAYTRIGKQFDDLSGRNTLVIDQQAGKELGDALRGYNEVVAPSLRSPAVENLIGDIAAKNAQGPIAGDFYQTTSSKLAKLARETNDPQLKNAVLDIRSSLDDAMERSIAANNPGDLGGFREARNQYRNLLAITKAATGAGENSALGIISPQALRQAAVGQGRSAYARGQGDFADLARSGNATMTPLANSGTAMRLAARGGGGGLGAVIGALTTGGNPLGAAAGAAAFPLINAGVGRALMSVPAQAYLKNQVLSQAPQAGQKLQSVIRALLQNDEARRQVALTENNR